MTIHLVASATRPRRIRDGKLDPLIVYEAYVARRLDLLPTAETMTPLMTALEEPTNGALPDSSLSEETRRKPHEKLEIL